MIRLLVTGIFLGLTVANPAIANDSKSAGSKSKEKSEMSSAKKEEMASIHEKMASCLRSDKSVNECNTEMHKRCTEMMGKQGCHMDAGMSGMVDQYGNKSKDAVDKSVGSLSDTGA